MSEIESDTPMMLSSQGKRRMCVVDSHAYYGLKERVVELEAERDRYKTALETIRTMPNKPGRYNTWLARWIAAREVAEAALAGERQDGGSDAHGWVDSEAVADADREQAARALEHGE